MVLVPTSIFTPHGSKIDINIKNKQILYQDRMLNLDDFETHTVASVLYVDEEQLQECLEVVLQNNSDVTIDTIQYSRTNKKVYFYANYSSLDFSCWYNNKMDSKVHDQVQETINDIEDMLNKSITSPSIPLIDYIQIFNSTYNGAEAIEKKYEDKIEKKLDARSVSLYSYSNDRVCVSIKYDYDWTKWDDYKFKITDNDLKLIETKIESSRPNRNIMNDIGPIVNQYLRKTIKLQDYYDAESITWGSHIFYSRMFGNFYVRKSRWDKSKRDFVNLFTLKFSADNEDTVEIEECSSLKLSNYLENNMNKILNNYMIPCKLLPKFVQEKVKKEEAERQEEETRTRKQKEQEKIELNKKREEMKIEILKRREEIETLNKEKQIEYEEKEKNKLFHNFLKKEKR